MKGLGRAGTFNPLRQLMWRLTLTYTLVSLTAIFLMGWWGFLVATIYLGRAQPHLTWQQIVLEQLLPTLSLVLPGMALLIIPAALLSASFGFLSARWLDRRLNRMHTATEAWRRGDFSIRIRDDSKDEVGAFGRGLDIMAGEMEQLLQTRQNLAALEERYRLARDLHDSVKQSLTAAGFQLSAGLAHLERDPPAARGCFEQSRNLAYEAQTDLSAILFELRPPALKETSLAPALKDHLEKWSQRTGVKSEFELSGERKLSPAAEECLFRLLQEALSNIERHSSAGSARVCLSYGPEATEIRIQDDGSGFPAERPSPYGQGLRNMNERLASLGGILEVKSSPGQGTLIIGKIPHQVN
jgi:two-component system, NarL family, sensor histidine kinase LiaS